MDYCSVPAVERFSRGVCFGFGFRCTKCTAIRKPRVDFVPEDVKIVVVRSSKVRAKFRYHFLVFFVPYVLSDYLFPSIFWSATVSLSKRFMCTGTLVPSKRRHLISTNSVPLQWSLVYSK